MDPKDVSGKSPGGEVAPLRDEYWSIFDHIPIPVFILDRRNLKILDCNSKVTDVYEYSRQELLKASFLMLFEDGEQQNYALELRNSDSLDHAKQITRSGTNIFVNIRVSPHEYMGIKALLVTTSDIIKVLMVRQQLVQISKLATLGEMATGIAHELNQPLSVIKTASSFLMGKIQGGQPLKEAVFHAMIEEIDGHADRASAIIGLIREFGRKSSVKREPVMVNAVLQSALDMFHEQLRLREIGVERSFQETLPPVMADKIRLEQVFINLLINARDAIEEKREKLGRRDAGPGKITVSTCQSGRQVVVEIRDTGIGIPSAIRDSIFEPFFTTKPPDKGTGLGLSISYGIIQDHKGTLCVETEENAGSNFIIHLPVWMKSHGR
jgi:histidine kinase